MDGKRVLLRITSGISWLLAAISGAAAGLFGSMCVSLAAMIDMGDMSVFDMAEEHNIPVPDGMSEAEVLWSYFSKWFVSFNSENLQADLIMKTLWLTIAAGAVFLLELILICVFTGKLNRNEDGSIHINRFDKIWAEVQIALMILASGLAICLADPLYEIWPCCESPYYTPSITDGYVFGAPNDSIIVLCLLGMSICILLACLFFVSMIKKIKAGCLGKSFLIGRFFGWLKRILNDLIDEIRRSDRLLLKYILISLGMIILAMTWVGAIVDIILVCIYVTRAAREFREIKEGVEEVRSGNLTYKIPYSYDEKGPKSNLDKLAADINEISQATNLAVQNELKNQRMKTDLISNVSHDLKTPLTSMISYVDLLKKEGLDSPNAGEYLDVIEQKTSRLKNLTENLFEAAKASSGNIPCNMQPIDISAIVSQANAEMEERLAEHGLSVIVKNELERNMVMADGQLLWRVIENLLSNVSKYALDESRVYINLSNIPGKKVMLEMKNISRDELNISAEELMERFKRGDESRNTEGSGLGLAIAKDLTTLMNGVFEITVDGDLFKATVLLNEAE